MFESNTHTLDACRITLKRGGRGRPLLYLHGASGAAQIQPFMEKLAQRYDVLVPEHPGFGGSDEPAWLDNIHDLAYFYLGFLEHFDLRDAIVVGSSIGGWLALEIAVRSTARIGALSLIGPSGIYVEGEKRGDMFLWTPEERVRNLFHDQALAERMLAQPMTPEAQEVAVKNGFTVAKLAWEPRLFDPHLHKWLHRVRVPTQIIWGEHDKILPVGYAHAFAKLIPGAHVDIISACGHLPQAEQPDAFLRAFDRFAATL